MSGCTGKDAHALTQLYCIGAIFTGLISFFYFHPLRGGYRLSGECLIGVGGLGWLFRYFVYFFRQGRAVSIAKCTGHSVLLENV